MTLEPYDRDSSETIFDARRLGEGVVGKYLEDWALFSTPMKSLSVDALMHRHSLSSPHALSVLEQWGIHHELK